MESNITELRNVVARGTKEKPTQKQRTHKTLCSYGNRTLPIRSARFERTSLLPRTATAGFSFLVRCASRASFTSFRTSTGSIMDFDAAPLVDWRGDAPKTPRAPVIKTAVRQLFTGHGLGALRRHLRYTGLRPRCETVEDGVQSDHRTETHHR